MSYRVAFLLSRLMMFVLFSSTFILASENSSQYLGPIDLLTDRDPGNLYILERDAQRIRKVHVLEKRDDAGFDSTKPEFLALPFLPERMRFSPDRKLLAVVGGSGKGTLALIDPTSMTIRATIPVGHSPSDCAIVLPKNSDETTRIFVSNRFEGNISVIRWNDQKSIGEEEKRIPAGREPIALAAVQNGQELVVAGHLPEDPALQFDIAARIRWINTETGETTWIRLPHGAMNLRDIAVSPDERYVFISGIFGNFEHLTDSVRSGWMNENHLYIVDRERREFICSQIYDLYGTGAANPWGLTLSDDSQFLLGTASGTNDLILFNLPKLLERLDQFTDRTIDRKISNLMQDLPDRMRIPLSMKGVRYATMNARGIFATAYFEDALLHVTPQFKEPIRFTPGITPLDNLEIPRTKNLYIRAETNTSLRANVVSSQRISVEAQNEVGPTDPLRFIPLESFNNGEGIQFQRRFARLGTEPTWTKIRYGEMLFHDATCCDEHWQSCTSCHPEARADALNWDLLNDGQDNPKNTKSLLLSHRTPPSMSTGIREKAEIAVRKGFETILMVPATEQEAQAVDAFLINLKPVPSPRRIYDRTEKSEDGVLSKSAQKGQLLFNSDKAYCYVCHPEPLYTDMKMHNVGTQSIYDSNPDFDTPTLVEVWRTAPYLHDGRYTTVKQLITEGKHVNIKGCLDRLTETEVDDLVEFVLSL